MNESCKNSTEFSSMPHSPSPAVNVSVFHTYGVIIRNRILTLVQGYSLNGRPHLPLTSFSINVFFPVSESHVLAGSNSPQPPPGCGMSSVFPSLLWEERSLLKITGQLFGWAPPSGFVWSLFMIGERRCILSKDAFTDPPQLVPNSGPPAVCGASRRRVWAQQQRGALSSGVRTGRTLTGAVKQGDIWKAAGINTISQGGRRQG